MPSTTLTSDGIVLAAAMMRRGGNRGRLLSLVGQAPYDEQHFHYLSTHQGAYLLGISARSVGDLFVELVAGGVLERRPGAGSRPDGWRARGDIRRWSVEWPRRRAPDGADFVRLVMVEHGYLVAVVPGMPAASVPGSIAGREAELLPGSIAGRRESLLPGPRAGQEGPRYRPAMGPGTPSSSSWSPGPRRPPLRVGGPSLRVVGGVGEEEEEEEGESKLAEEEPYARALASIVYRVTGRPVWGRGLTQLARVKGRLSLERAERALAGVPGEPSWPMVLAALEHAAEQSSSSPPERAETWLVPVSWRNGDDHDRVETRRCQGLAAAWTLVNDLRAGHGWPDGASGLEVDDPVKA
jgi:hypothetical protein